MQLVQHGSGTWYHNEQLNWYRVRPEIVRLPSIKNPTPRETRRTFSGRGNIWGSMMPSVRDDVEIILHEHRFLVTKLLESVSSSSLYVHYRCFFFA